LLLPLLPPKPPARRAVDEDPGDHGTSRDLIAPPVSEFALLELTVVVCLRTHPFRGTATSKRSKGVDRIIITIIVVRWFFGVKI
jgi:hypothetical protein